MKTKEQKIEEINGQLTMLLNFVTYHEREQYKETSKDKPPTPNDANLVLLGFEEEATPYNSKHFELFMKDILESINIIEIKQDWDSHKGWDLLLKMRDPVTDEILIDNIPVQCKNYQGEVLDIRAVSDLKRCFQNSTSNIAYLFIIFI